MHTRIDETIKAQPPFERATSEPFVPISRDWPICCALMLVTAATSFATYVTCWLPGPEAQIYMALARNIAAGRGFEFNGELMVLVPPLWPYALAGLMRLRSDFWFLHLAPIVLQAAALPFWFFYLRRFTTAARAFVVLLLCSQLYWWRYASMALVSEGLFMLFFSAAMLLAMQIAERRRAGWRIAALTLLCILMVSARWAGLIAWPLIGATLIIGSLRPRLDARWLALVITAAATVGSFRFNEYLIERVLPRSAGEAIVVGNVESAKITALMPELGEGTYFARSVRAGRWVASLFWMPFELGISSHFVAAVGNILGWLLIGVMAAGVCLAMKQGRWIWLGVVVYCGALCIRWRMPVARYFVPVAPLLLWAVWSGTEQLRSIWSNRFWRALCTVSLAAFLASVAVTGLSLWATDVYIAHSADYYARYHAGHGKALLAAVTYVKQRNLKDGELAVAGEYQNLTRSRHSGSIRATHLLTDRRIMRVPRKVCSGRPNEKLLKWAHQNGVRYYLYRPPVSPWRVWHFRMPTVQKLVTHQQHIPENPLFVLYDVTGSTAVEVKSPQEILRPTRVPGLD